MAWRRSAMLIVVPVAAAAGLWSLQPYAEVGTVPMTACYVALANDLTPLLHAGAPDAAASSAECAALDETSTPTTTSDERSGRHADVVVSTSKTPRALMAPRGRTAAPSTADRASRSARTTIATCRDDANVVDDLITQCFP